LNSLNAKLSELLNGWSDGGIHEEPSNFGVILKTGKFKIDFTQGDSIADVLGFENKVYAVNTENRSSLPIKLLRGHYKVTCNLVEGSFTNCKPTRIIHEFSHPTRPLEHIFERPSKIIYFPLTRDHIREIHVQIVDENDKPVDFGGAYNVDVRLHLISH